MPLNRREFLQVLGGTGVVSLSGVAPFWTRSLQAEPAPLTSGRALVIIELAGGNDGLNTVIPYADDAYYAARPGIGIPRGSVLKLNDAAGLHPQMGGFKELFDEGQLAVVQGVGYPNPDRSHFRSMDIWHSARPETTYTRDGWLGRAVETVALQQPGSLPALALGRDRLPLALVSTCVNLPALSNLETYRWTLGEDADKNRPQAAAVRELAALPAPAGSELEFLRQTSLTAFHSAARLRELAADRSGNGYPDNFIATQLRIIAQLIAGELGAKVYFISLGGFDTHSQQQAVHQGLLGQLGSAVRAFFKDLQDRQLADRVLLATFSEFGRRVKENGSLGTDHGAASQMFLAGPGIKPGVHGPAPSLTDLDDGDLKHHTDFRQVYAALLERWLQLPSETALHGAFTPADVIQ